jgi:hypothetical protein
MLKLSQTLYRAVRFCLATTPSRALWLDLVAFGLGWEDPERLKLFLRKDSGTNDILLTGTSELTDISSVQTRSFIVGVLDVPAGGLTTMLDHRIGSVPNNSVLGTSNNVSGADEVYTQIKIQKIQ